MVIVSYYLLGVAVNSIWTLLFLLIFLFDTEDEELEQMKEFYSKHKEKMLFILFVFCLASWFSYLVAILPYKKN